MGRELVLERVRAALAGAPVPALLPVGTTTVTMSVPDREAMVTRFTREALAVGSVVHAVATTSAASAVVAEIAAGARRVIAWPTTVAQAVACDAHHEGEAWALTILGAATPDALVAAADVGITEADVLVAASGTVVIGATGRHRAASLLPPLHVVVAPVERMVVDLAAALTRLRAGPPPAESCVTLITGPSRTADIEKKLVLGVHGPCELHIVLIGADAAPGSAS